jgi:hypothetical protein
MKMPNWLSSIKWPQTPPWLWIMAAALSGFAAYYWDATAPASAPIHEPEPVESASTLIPAGFVLVPIEVANFESLDSILGKFGTVDLFIPTDDPKQKARKVAHRVRMLRAPLNPSRFAVLVRESESPRLVTHNGPFIVAVQNPKAVGTRDASNETSVGEANDIDERIRVRRSRITVEVINGTDK